MISFDWLTLQFLAILYWALNWYYLGILAGRITMEGENDLAYWILFFAWGLLIIPVTWVPDIPLSMIFR